jgi:hypothetical protein
MMKSRGANLWTLILNGGLRGDKGSPRGEVYHRIIKAPIILDCNPMEPQEAFDTDEFCCLAVPFSTFWIESTPCRGFQRGTLVDAVRTKDGWKLSMIVAYSPPGEMPGIIQRDSIIYLDQNGDPKLDGLFESKLSESMARRCEQDQEFRHYIASGLRANIYAVLQVLTLLSAHNVSLEKRAIEPKQARRAAKRHGGQPWDYKFHVLTVRPAGSKLGTPGVEIGAPGSAPLHLRRGHFHEYGPQYGKGLLFGRIAGRFYIPPTACGDAKNGIIDHDLKVA